MLDLTQLSRLMRSAMARDTSKLKSPFDSPEFFVEYAQEIAP